MPDTATLEAHLAISKVKARYCRMLDTKDWAGFGALFTEDFVLDYHERYVLKPGP
nr:nuclear transport factor 2 family protein [Peristeroidobacter soli]